MNHAHQALNTNVVSRAYRLVKPRDVQDIVIEHEVHDWEVVVEPKIGSVCHADLRYFTGQRRAEALARKLPMALIHEGIGTIIQSKNPHVQPGQRVVIVPNLQGYLIKGLNQDQCCETCRGNKGNNYCTHGRFLGSGMDGIAQSRLVVPAASAIPIPAEVPDEIAVLTELCSVSYQALSHVADRLTNANIVIFGDGPVGYLAAAMLQHVYKVDLDRITVFGAVPEKLEKFDCPNRKLVQEYDFSSGTSYDIALECTGGKFSEGAINQAIDVLNPGGHLILMGVTEERVPINTRDVLEKGLTLKGSSRSSIEDFIPVLHAMKDPTCQATLSKLLPSAIIEIKSNEDFAEAMAFAEEHRSWTKVLLDFRWEPSC
ncbi:alcohol dehydrogenase catalytic domain-containing protein [Paenibacillus qinlingensis]|uniref:Ribitol-5-phosphate 2-dehydrogenase n=1 Tax=Paenibacillus qinlingensis TaxID=1837343 RepID=A0ABU1P0P1_9BACL|nr:alcohol dehydrogenase catalytic domain-containing protein [Paenibacillus qinlingensis]MDR6553318.1 ribitol-5-phosphate 2-dehydrogenase [Paenibacillus qinlingensis]